jgi:hypothetical protein
LQGVKVALPVWYACPGKAGALKIEPATRVIRAALAAAYPHEKTALGYSYRHGFSAPSEGIHFSTHAKRHDSLGEAVQIGAVAVMLLSSAITSRIGALAGLATTLPLDRGGKLAAARLPEVGDFAVVALDRESLYLTEVLERSDGKGVIGRVRVRFVGDSPYPDILEDVFPSDVVYLFQRRAELTRATLEHLGPGFPTDDLEASVRAGVEKAWTLAMRSVWLEWLGTARRRLARSAAR